jgi:hypothetical protein
MIFTLVFPVSVLVRAVADVNATGGGRVGL